jgi:glutathione S-transferase
MTPEDDAMLDLYHHGSSVCAAKVRFALGEKGLEWQGHYLDILKGDQFAPEYQKLNPKAVVPTLVHDGQVIVESTVINEYIDEVFAETPLKPRSPVERAEMRVWTKAVDEICIRPAARSRSPHATATSSAGCPRTSSRRSSTARRRFR